MGVDTWKQPFVGNTIETAVDYTVESDDNVILLTGAPLTITLDSKAFEVGEWKRFFDNTGLAALTPHAIVPDTGQISGGVTVTLSENYCGVDIMWDGTNYLAVARNNGEYAGVFEGNVNGNLTGNVSGKLSVPANITADPILLNGTARVWDDLLKFTASNIPKNPIVAVPAFDYDEVLFTFINTSVETVVGNDQMPHSYKLGSDARPHLHFYRNATGRVRFRLAYKWFDNTAGWTGWTQIYASSTYKRTYANTTGYPQILMFPMLSGTNITRASSVFKFKLSRMGNVTQDTHHGEFYFDEFDLHGQKDRIGTKNEYV